MKLFRRTILIAIIAAVCLTGIASAQSYAPIKLSKDERYAMNLFLSNFTEIGIDEISTWSMDNLLVDFAHDHMWFNSYDDFEYGNYFNGNNCRVSNDKIQKYIDKYFYDAGEVNLWETRFDYDGEYYYHCETGGWINSGFAQTVSVCSLGYNEYYVSFMIFGSGEFWENDVMHLNIDQAADTYGSPGGFGHALVYAKDLSDRSTYKMIEYS